MYDKLTRVYVTSAINTINVPGIIEITERKRNRQRLLSNYKWCHLAGNSHTLTERLHVLPSSDQFINVGRDENEMERRVTLERKEANITPSCETRFKSNNKYCS